MRAAAIDVAAVVFSPVRPEVQSGGASDEWNLSGVSEEKAPRSQNEHGAPARAKPQNLAHAA